MREIFLYIHLFTNPLSSSLRLLCAILSTETALFMDRSRHFILLSMKRWLLVDGNAKQSGFYVEPKHEKTAIEASLLRFCCGATGNRTRDTRIFSPLLYQLSYGTRFSFELPYLSIGIAKVDIIF